MTLQTTDSLPKAGRMEIISKWLQIHKGLGISMMDHLYNQLDGLYPGQWAGKFKSEASIQNWRETWAWQFENDGITPGHIKAALVECVRRYHYPPKFVTACKATVVPNAKGKKAFPFARDWPGKFARLAGKGVVL